LLTHEFNAASKVAYNANNGVLCVNTCPADAVVEEWRVRGSAMLDCYTKTLSVEERLKEHWTV
jgi:epoxyqueuosine reductase QueG